MRPRVRSRGLPPTRGPQGGAGVSGAAPYLRPSFSLSTSAEPEYRWTFKTWIDHRWETYSGKHQRIENERTMTVIASTETAAKAKILAALAAPATDGRDHEKRERTRKWELQGTVEEVTQ